MDTQKNLLQNDWNLLIAELSFLQAGEIESHKSLDDPPRFTDMSDMVSYVDTILATVKRVCA